MPFCPLIRMACTLLLSGSILLAAPALADEPAAPGQEAPEPHSSSSLLERAATRAGAAVERSLELVGIRYRRGGSDAETGFDCSGFVGYVFRETMGLVLPRTSKEISRTGEPVDKSELEPGDLVFFNTMRHAFSHVGIYLGDHQFVHAPRTGRVVRVEDLRDRYWAKRYNGARRIEGR